MIIPLIGEVPDHIVNGVVMASGTIGTALAGHLALKRSTDKKALVAQRTTDLAARKAEVDEARRWRQELREENEALRKRQDALEAELDATRVELAITKRELAETSLTLTYRTRELDRYERDLTIFRGENAVLKSQMALLQIEIDAVRRMRGGRRETDGV